MPTQVNASGNPDIDALLWGYRWDVTNLTYSVPTSTSVYAGYPVGGIVGFQSLNTPVFNAMIARIINLYDSVCGLSFTLQNDPNAIANIRYAKVTTIDIGDGAGAHVPGGGSAECIPPAPEFPAAAQGDAWFSEAVTAPPPLGGHQYAAWLIHEPGHGVGLKHGHNPQMGHGTQFPKLPNNHDSQEYSIMTYARFAGEDGNTRLPQASLNATDYPTTLMQDDIMALQYMYGADYGPASNNGNTTYTWSASTGEMFLNGVGQGAHFRNKILLTIWDGGGNDTYDLSNFSTNQTIDLRPGQWTTVSTGMLAELAGEAPGSHLARGNIANAMLDPNTGSVASLIENANGGSGNDNIIGNVLANTLNGGNGSDTFTGAEGNDFLIGGYGGDVSIYGGNLANYNVVRNSNGTVTVTDTRAGSPSGVDTLSRVEFLQFADRFMTTTVQDDFNGDLRGDILLQNGAGQAVLWQMNGTGITSAAAAGPANGANWRVQGIGDLTGEGAADLVWVDTNTGQAVIWQMIGSTLVAAGAAGPANGAAWQVRGVSDFNGDGNADLVWQNVSTGQAALWLMNGASILGAALIGPALGADWQIRGVGDFNGDRQQDIIWQNSGGQTVGWLLNAAGGIGTAAAIGGANGSTWQVSGVGDINGDGRSDIIWKYSNGQAGCFIMNGTTITSAAAIGTANGANWDIRSVNDLNGDGRADLVWENTAGQASAWLLNGSTIQSAAIVGGANGADWLII
jgi:Peptidase M10 serralysin C terminal/FG-GAP-like repeat